MTTPKYPEDDFSASDDEATAASDNAGLAETESKEVSTDAGAGTTEPTAAPQKAQGSFAASTWAALIVGFLLLIVLIIFIMQNQQEVPMNFLGWSGQFPAGIAYLMFTIGGALIMALVGVWRMLELRRQLRKQAEG
ncbi:LapA family protein [Corynebacterium accolens]|uniref:LapA family protein n=1 Tax=Corynebacterium accolens TaxID=38284 RepID=UPI00254FE4CB|nr:lipopolysaccharide assembly protein LapA domain-containing protein [Corynebacterium accolens]MDK8468776.1 lipopolysaccharide assembly protein LapA domain-containing protein [Corynebacterium accolens]MDK8497338.1 lipopolysaccharide assembly protein LapA domain-containing protein [Corynebacterium accolens]MDK8592170.1 lipopolysaccharide assembly protein LapA domain-containing protein [Corynebacterium accolens]